MDLRYSSYCFDFITANTRECFIEPKIYLLSIVREELELLYSNRKGRQLFHQGVANIR